MNKTAKESKLLLFWSVLVAIITVFTIGHVFAFGDGENFEFEWLTKPKNANVYRFTEGRVWVQEKENGPWTLYDQEWNVVKANFEANFVNNFDQGITCFAPKTKWGYYGFLNLSGDIISPPADYGMFAVHSEGLICKMGENGMVGFVNLAGEWIIPPKYDYSWADKTGHEAPPSFQDNGYCVVTIGKGTSKKKGIIDRKGQWVVPPEYDEVGRRTFQEGLVPVRKGEKWGYLNEKGEVVIDFLFDSVENFLNGSAVVGAGSLYGLIDKSGRYIVEPKYEAYVKNRSDTQKLIAVAQGGKMGFIDRKGNLVIDFKFEYRPTEERGLVKPIYSYNFEKDRAVVLIEEKSNFLGVIDEAGNVLYTVDGVRMLRSFSGDYLVVSTRDGLFLYDREGRKYNISRYLRLDRLISIGYCENNIFRVAYKVPFKQYFLSGLFKITVKEEISNGK
jgi:hypothetical protein